MTSSKSTKRALISSTLAILMCVAMLIGTTFAWFTDTASTAVNKIQAGNLEIELQMKDNNGNWVNAEGKTLGWVAKDGRAQDQILWEPGCTYKLPTLKITNKGNLALQFKILVNNISGDMDLLNALEFTCTYAPFNEAMAYEPVTIQGSDIADLPFELPGEPNVASNAEEFGITGSMLPDSGYDDTYEANVAYYTIEAHMKEEAGNEYQGKALENLSVTVVATQIAGFEKDSFDDLYDRYAQYPDVTVVQLAAGDETAVNNALKDAIAAAKTADAATGKPTPTQIVLPSNTTVCLDSGEATPAQGLTSDIKITGDKTTTVKLQNTNPGSEGSLSYQDGANLTFQGITVDTEGIKGICARGGVVTFIDCTFNSELKQTIAAKFIFSGCTFTEPVSQVGYGCNNVIFSNCKFNTDGYGIKIYSEGNSPVNLTVKNCAFNNSGSAAKSAIFLDHIIDGISYNITVDSCSFSGFAATPTANVNNWAERMIVADSFVKTSDGQYIFSYQTGAEGGSYHKILTDDQLVVTVK